LSVPLPHLVRGRYIAIAYPGPARHIHDASIAWLFFSFDKRLAPSSITMKPSSQVSSQAPHPAPPAAELPSPQANELHYSKFQSLRKLSNLKLPYYIHYRILGCLVLFFPASTTQSTEVCRFFPPAPPPSTPGSRPPGQANTSF
jgi:hypothetical protein